MFLDTADDQKTHLKCTQNPPKMNLKKHSNAMRKMCCFVTSIFSGFGSEFGRFWTSKMDLCSLKTDDTFWVEPVRSVSVDFLKLAFDIFQFQTTLGRVFGSVWAYVSAVFFQTCCCQAANRSGHCILHLNTDNMLKELTSTRHTTAHCTET